jgi:NTP pyrophosphatase (non-canonical NTP hydrolase)
MLVQLEITGVEDMPVTSVDEQSIIIGECVIECHSRSLKAGWYTNPKTGERLERNVGEMLALIHSEVSEALEGHRKNLKDDHLPNRPMVEVELADTLIRVFDLAGYLGLDLGGAYAEKLAYNLSRADHQLENRAKEGGKAF